MPNPMSGRLPTSSVHRITLPGLWHAHLTEFSGWFCEVCVDDCSHITDEEVEGQGEKITCSLSKGNLIYREEN